MNDDGTVEKAVELLQPGESAIVVAVLKNEQLLFINSDHTGTTGNWKQSPNVTSDKVIIYVRKPRRSDAEVWVGDFVSSTPSKEWGRVEIAFRNARLAATTYSNWLQFAMRGQTPNVVIHAPRAE